MSKAQKTKKLSKEEIKREEEESGKRVSGEPEANLAAIGAGAITGAATGAAVGTAAGGPIGAAIGAAAGAAAGAITADQIQDELDPKLEEVYWEENYKSRPYYRSDRGYQYYLPAYQFGWESAARKEYENRTFIELEDELKAKWESQHEGSDWSSVREIAHDAFDRIRQRRNEVR